MNANELENKMPSTSDVATILQPDQNDSDPPAFLCGDVLVGGSQRCPTYSEIASEIRRISDQANDWTSIIVIPHGISKLDISSAVMGASSYTPIGATKQPHEYPRWGSSSSVYRFDPDLFNENSWPDLQRMLTKMGCVSGCRVVLRQC
jgi:hypothetical protein